MRGYIVEQPGGRFQEIEVPRPAPATNEVLVRICASGVNPLDAKIRGGGAPHARQPLPAVLGLDMAGIVEELVALHSDYDSLGWFG
jgi:NADPH:quinone reductase-like Zn-dependent oxidoreductase